MEFTWKATSTASKSPITRFLEWKWASDRWEFEYYDKQTDSKNVFTIDKPFIVLRMWSSVKWWSDSASSGIWSNEVLNTTTEEMVVKTKKWVLARWKWNDIKETVKAAWWHFQRAITILIDWEVVGFWLKGAALMEWSEFTKEFWNSLQRNYVVLKWTEARKKWAIKYIVPLFWLSEDVINDDDITKAIEASNLVREYYSNKPKEEDPIVSADVEEEIDLDLPF